MIAYPARSYIEPARFQDCFPSLREAISEAERATLAPSKLVAHSAVNAMFCAVQGLADLEQADGTLSPISNISLIVGGTLGCKAEVDACFFGPIYAFREQSKATEDDEHEYRARVRAWKAEGKILDKRVDTALKEQSPNHQQILGALKHHESLRPQKPPSFMFAYGDTSPALLKNALLNYPAACVASPLGMSFFKGSLYREQALLCQMHYGRTHDYDYGSSARTIENKRLSVSAHSPTRGTYAYLRAYGRDFLDADLAACMTPCLLTESMFGINHPYGIRQTRVPRGRYESRIHDMLCELKRSAKIPNYCKRKVKLSSDATRYSLQFTETIDREMQRYGRLEHLQDYARQLPNKVERLAAGMHVLEDFEGDVSTETLVAAQMFYEEATKDYLYLCDYLPSTDHLADQLLHWLRNQTPRNFEPGIRKSEILICAPKSIRTKAAANAAIGRLIERNSVHLVPYRGATLVCLGPNPQPSGPMLRWDEQQGFHQP